jgi:hypothetical protein
MSEEQWRMKSLNFPINWLDMAKYDLPPMSEIQMVQLVEDMCVSSNIREGEMRVEGKALKVGSVAWQDGTETQLTTVQQTMVNMEMIRRGARTTPYFTCTTDGTGQCFTKLHEAGAR